MTASKPQWKSHRPDRVPALVTPQPYLSPDSIMTTSHLPGDVPPLSSPTLDATDSTSYFGSLPPQSQRYPQTQAQQQARHPSLEQQRSQPQPQQQHPHQQQQPQQKPPALHVPHNSQTSATATHQQPPIRSNSDSSSSSETSLHLLNGNLLAAAAERAQLGICEREIEEMQL